MAISNISDISAVKQAVKNVVIQGANITSKGGSRGFNLGNDLATISPSQNLASAESGISNISSKKRSDGTLSFSEKANRKKSLSSATIANAVKTIDEEADKQQQHDEFYKETLKKAALLKTFLSGIQRALGVTNAE